MWRDHTSFIASSLQTTKIRRGKLLSIQHTLFFFFFLLFFLIFSDQVFRCCKLRLISTLTIDFIKNKEIIYILNYLKRSPNKYSFLKSQNQTSLCNNSKQPFITGIHSSTHNTHTRWTRTPLGSWRQLVWHSITSPLTKELEADLPVSCFHLTFGVGVEVCILREMLAIKSYQLFLFSFLDTNFKLLLFTPLVQHVPSITLFLVVNIFSFNFHM